jgi:mannose-6-phosphate isomerase-like protein (cupin superfamily)
MKYFRKNFLKIEPAFDFNKLSLFLDKNNFISVISSNYLNNYICQSIFQIRGVENTAEFKNVCKELNILFNKNNSNYDLDIFYSMVSGSSSISHEDEYDVVIINLFGKVLYKHGKDLYELNPGDLLYIPKNTFHKAIGITPRIVLSHAIK